MTMVLPCDTPCQICITHKIMIRMTVGDSVFYCSFAFYRIYVWFDRINMHIAVTGCDQ
jgi:hypothetical protein